MSVWAVCSLQVALCFFFCLSKRQWVYVCMYVCIYIYIYIISYILYYIHVVIICYYYNSFIDLTRGHPWVIWMSFSTASNRWDVQVPPGATQQLPSCNQLENPEFIDHFHQFPWIFIYFPMNKWGFPRWLQQASWTMWARWVSWLTKFCQEWWAETSYQKNRIWIISDLYILYFYIFL